MFKVRQIDHVGIRVTQRSRAQRFYEQLGFRIDPDEESEHGGSCGLVNDAGARINLICNGVGPPRGRNVLMDVDDKWPGYTHAAFIVDDLDALVTWLNARRIAITEGPVVFGHGRRKVCFVRDPDGNVVEFDEILGGEAEGSRS